MDRLKAALTSPKGAWDEWSPSNLHGLNGSEIEICYQELQ